jgi:SAM-dependent methyltransferase
MQFIYKVKKLIVNTPLNRNFIADSYLKKRIGEASIYVKGKVLDVGCGEKPYEKLFKEVIDTYIGVDQLRSHQFYASNTKVDVYGDASHLPFKAKSFDTVLCTEVLPHIEKPHLCFSEISRVMNTGGILILTANKTWERRTGLPVPDLWRFTDQGLRLLAEQHNLDVIYTKPGCGFLGTIGQLICRFLNKEFIYRKSLNEGVDKSPSLLAALFVLPIIAFIQILFSLFEKLYHSKIDTIFYILVARKP